MFRQTRVDQHPRKLQIFHKRPKYVGNCEGDYPQVKTSQVWEKWNEEDSLDILAPLDIICNRKLASYHKTGDVGEGQKLGHESFKHIRNDVIGL